MRKPWDWEHYSSAYEGWWEEGAYVLYDGIGDSVAAVSRDHPDVHHRFAASEDMLKLLKDLNSNGFDFTTKKIAHVRELIARAEGKTE